MREGAETSPRVLTLCSSLCYNICPINPHNSGGGCGGVGVVFLVNRWRNCGPQRLVNLFKVI